eukprot:504768_1
MSYNLLYASVIAAATETIKEQNDMALSQRLTENKHLKDCITICLKTLISFLDNQTIINLFSINELKNSFNIQSNTFDPSFWFQKVTNEYVHNYNEFKKEYSDYINSSVNGGVRIWIPMVQIWDISNIVNKSLLTQYNYTSLLFHLCLTEKVMFDLLDEYTEIQDSEFNVSESDKPYNKLHKIINTQIDKIELNNMIKRLNINRVNHFGSQYVKIGMLLDVLVKKTKTFDSIFYGNMNDKPFGDAKVHYNNEYMVESLKKLLLIPLIDPLIKDWVVIDGKLGAYSLSIIFGYVSTKHVVVIGGVYDAKLSTMSLF